MEALETLMYYVNRMREIENKIAEIGCPINENENAGHCYEGYERS